MGRPTPRPPPVRVALEGGPLDGAAVAFQRRLQAGQVVHVRRLPSGVVHPYTATARRDRHGLQVCVHTRKG